jgi:hypothetical protein
MRQKSPPVYTCRRLHGLGSLKENACVPPEDRVARVLRVRGRLIRADESRFQWTHQPTAPVPKYLILSLCHFFVSTAWSSPLCLSALFPTRAAIGGGPRPLAGAPPSSPPAEHLLVPPPLASGNPGANCSSRRRAPPARTAAALRPPFNQSPAQEEGVRSPQSAVAPLLPISLDSVLPISWSSLACRNRRRRCRRRGCVTGEEAVDGSGSGAVAGEDGVEHFFATMLQPFYIFALFVV